MSTFALVFNGIVAQVDAQSFPVNSAMTWVDVTAFSPAPEVGWTATQSGAAWTFAAPTLPPQPQQPPLRTQLSALDMDIPRGLEDLWAASGFDTTKLPAATQTKLASKVSLRAQLAALIAAATP